MVVDVPATPVTHAPVVTAPVGCETYRHMVQQYDWDVRIMMAIMEAENRSCDPSNRNLSPAENHGVCVGSYGLLQVGCVHFSGNQNPNDPATNIAVGYAVWKKQGYNAWTQYRNGEYLKFLH